MFDCTAARMHGVGRSAARSIGGARAVIGQAIATNNSIGVVSIDVASTGHKDDRRRPWGPRMGEVEISRVREAWLE
jgi:hypothetical protein